MVICQAHAASVISAGEGLENFTTSKQYTNELSDDIWQELTTTPPLTTTTRPRQFYERLPKQIRLHPFVLWWSTIVQSVPQLIRQRNQKRKTLLPFDLHFNSSTTETPSFKVEAHDVNDIAAGLDILIPDSPTVFDQIPLD